MIPVTDEPMEGVAFDVQDHAWQISTIWTGTHGEMTSSDLHGAAHQMDAETPSGGKDKTEVDQSLCTREEEDIPPKAPRHSLA